MTRNKQSVLLDLRIAFPKAKFFHLDRRDLDYIVETLNEKPGGEPTLYAEALSRLLERLKESGGSLKRMMDGDPQLAEAVAQVCVTRWMPSTSGRAYLVLQPSWEHILRRGLTPDQVDRMRPEQFAALLFHVWTLNPECDKLAGPCARCGRYYIKKRTSQNIYCSRRCGNAATAVARTRERIEAERRGKMDRVKAAMKEWKRAKTQQSWKLWIAQKTGIDLRFLTRNFTETGAVKTKRSGRP